MVALKIEYDGAIIAISTGIAFIGAFAAVSLCEQYRLARISKTQTNPFLLMTFVAVSFAAVGIWGMHFIATSSFKLMTPDGVEVPIRFNIGMLFVSLAVVTVMEFIGLYACSTDSCFNKSKKEIVDMFISRASSAYNMAQIKAMGKFEILRIVCTHNLHRILFGGTVGGGGVAVMHYLGMMSMEFQGTIKYNPGLVALSVIIAVLSVLGGFWVFFRVLSLFPSMDILRVACALNGMFSLSGVHYIGLVSATYDYDPLAAKPDFGSTVSSHQLLVGILVASVVFCVIMQVYVLYDLRAWLLRISNQLRHADVVISTLKKQNNRGSDTTPGHASRDLIKYLRKYKALPADTTSDDPSDLEQGRAMLLYNDYSDEENDSDLSGDGRHTPHSPHRALTPNNSNLNLRVKPQRARTQSDKSSTQTVSGAYTIACDDFPLSLMLPGKESDGVRGTNDGADAVGGDKGGNGGGNVGGSKGSGVAGGGSSNGSGAASIEAAVSVAAATTTNTSARDGEADMRNALANMLV